MLESRQLFLDTSDIVALNYQFEGAVLERLVNLVESNSAHVYLTDITKKEVETRIASDVHIATQKLKNFRKDAKVLRNIDGQPFEAYFKSFDPEDAVNSLVTKWEVFLERAKANIIDTSNVLISEVFSQYFDKRPPFGEGKKKSEFPDAFVLNALEKWAEDNNCKFYIASKDPDMHKYCEQSERLIAVDSSAKFIDLVVSQDETLAQHVRDLMDTHDKEIVNAAEQMFQNLGFWLDDQDGDVNEVKVTRVDLDDYSVLDIREDGALLQVNATVYFIADVIYDDLDTAIYDSEDKVLIPLQTIHEEIEQEADITLTLEIGIDVENPDIFKIESLKIENVDQFGIPVSTHDPYYYK